MIVLLDSANSRFYGVVRFHKNLYMKKLSAIFLSCICAPSFAQNTNTIPVSATVTEACVIATGGAIDFGTYDATASNNRVRSQGLIQIKCTNGGASKRVALGEGKNAAPGSTCAIPSRRMVAEDGSYLSYQIYTSAAETVAWGHCVNNSMVLLPASVSSLDAQAVPAYGAIPAGQDAKKGTYTDTLTIRISF